MLTRGENIDGTLVPQANRIDKLVDRVRAACAGEDGWPGHDPRDTGYYSHAAALLGLLDEQQRATPAAHALVALPEEDQLAALARHVEASLVGQAWLTYCGARGLRELDESSAEPFLLARSNLSPSTASRRAATLRQWLAALRDHAPPVHDPHPLSGAAVAFLHQEVAADVRLPTRMLNWAARADVHTYADLLQRTRAQLAGEKNLGRGSIAQTSAVVEAATKLSWEDLHAALRARQRPSAAPPADADDQAYADGTLPWDAFATQLPAWLLAAPVELAQLPTRMRNHCAREGLATIGALVAIPHADLRETRNLGRKSVRESHEAILAMAARGHTGAAGDPPEPTLDDHTDVFALLRAELKRLTPNDRLVVTRRAGLNGAPATLSDIGEMLGVSRERVRQYETRAVRALAARWWVEPLRAALEAHLQQGVRPVSELAQTPFFAPVAEQTEEFDFFLDRLYGDDLSIVHVNDQPMLATGGRRQVAEAEAELLRTVKQLSFPVPEALVLGLAPRFANPIAPGLAPHFADTLRARLVVADGAEGRTVTGVGHTLQNAKLAHLEAHPEPVAVSELETRFGRGAIPDEAIYVARGHVTLPKHVPDFYLWQRRLVPLCVAVMSAGDPARQWSTPQLLEEIEDQVQLPEWLGHWHLASMLRLSDAVDYRGRLRVALPSRDGDQARVHVDDAARDALLKHGAPLAHAALLAHLTGTAGASETGATQLLARLPFVRVSDTHVGLAERDLPGGLEAIPAAVAALETELEEQQEGLAPVEAVAAVHALGAPHTRWTLPMLLSVVRAMGNLRTTGAGAVGLSEWERERMPTHRSMLDEALRTGGGRASVELLQDTIEARFGARPSRATLNVSAHALGARLDGAFIVSASHASATTPPPPLELPDPLSIPGFPLVAVNTFSAFLSEPVGDFAALAARAQAYVAQFEAAQHDNEFIDADEARALASVSGTLLAAVADDPDPTRRQLAWAAVRYFECEDDGDNDFVIGGLDDDAAVMNSVAAYLDLPHCTVAWT
ncbi:MAG: DNA-directed RNA polymerase subunit alpha C-terminal domain-containing protein [Polyangiales bacterium]